MKYFGRNENLPCAKGEDPCTPFITCSVHQIDTYHICSICGTSFTLGDYLQEHIELFKNPRRIDDVVNTLLEIKRKYGNVIVGDSDGRIPTLEYISKATIQILAIDEFYMHKHFPEEKFAVLI